MRRCSHISPYLELTAGLMRDINANPLDLVETDAAIMRRRRELSEILDSANPDLTGFHRRQGKMIVMIGTNDTLASPGAQLDYYQSVIDKMGQSGRRSVRQVLRHSSNRPWLERYQLLH